MPNRRHPSQACAPCKAKRRKCDFKKPVCSQCTRAGAECSFPDEGMRFPIRDQTQAVMSRFRSPESPSVESSSTAQASESLQPTMLANIVFPFPNSRGMSLVFSDFATAAYFNLFLAGQAESADSHDVFRSLNFEQTSHSMLRDILGAIGVVTHKDLNQDPAMNRVAVMRYSSALIQTQKALDTPELATKDETVMAIILLGIYELVACQHDHAYESWARHVDGAKTLLILRGAEQLRTHTGRALFMHLRHRIVVLSLWRGEPMPAPIVELSAINELFQSPDEAPTNELAKIQAAQCSLRARMNSEELTDPEAIHNELEEIDATLGRWRIGLPPSHNVTRCSSPPGPFILDGEYDVYTNRFIATTWNTYRICRMMLARRRIWLLERTESIGAAEKEERMAAAAKLIESLCIDICRSFCFSLGRDELSVAFNGACFDLHSATAIPWMARHVLLAETVSARVKGWVHELLAVLADECGMKQGRAISNAVTSGRDHHDWGNRTF